MHKVRHRRKRRVLIAALLHLLATVARKPPLLPEVTPLHIALLATVLVALEPSLLSLDARNRPLLSLLTTNLVTCTLDIALLSLTEIRATVAVALLPVAAILPLTQRRSIHVSGLLSLLTTDLVACALEPRLPVVTLLPKATLATR